MFLLYLTVSCVLFGGSSADVKYEEECCGPRSFSGQLYFPPSNRGSRKLLMDKGEAKDPRLKVSFGSVHFTDLTERDEGTFSISGGNIRQHDGIKPRALDYAEKIMKYYGDTYFCDIPRRAQFLEFIPLHSVDQPKVLWNRTNPQTVERGIWRGKLTAWEMKNLNQADMGHYNFRAKDNTLLSRILLEVKDHKSNHHAVEGKRLVLNNPSPDIGWTVTFTSEGEVEKKTLIKAGRLITESEWVTEPWTLRERIEVLHAGIAIHRLEVRDSGTFEYRDRQGHLARTVKVVVKQEPNSTIVYVGVAVGIFFGVVVCCCCVKKCCCKKSSFKMVQPAPQTAATPAVLYHNVNQPAGPRFSAAPAPNNSYQPMNSLVSRETTTISLEPPVYNPVNIHVNPLQPEVAPLGGQGIDPAPTVSSGCLSSDPGPKFELRGLSSTPPLSAESTLCHVYTSDKLNFL